MANTYTLISSITLASPAATMEFTSIPSTYTDLCIKLSLRTANVQGVDTISPRINGSAATFTQKWLYGTGSGTGSNSSASYWGDTEGSTYTASTFSSQDIYIPNYAGSTNKSMSVDNVTENNATASYAEMIAILWANTAAITSVGFTSVNGNFATYSTAYLYGVKNA